METKSVCRGTSNGSFGSDIFPTVTPNMEIFFKQTLHKKMLVLLATRCGNKRNSKRKGMKGGTMETENSS